MSVMPVYMLDIRSPFKKILHKHLSKKGGKTVTVRCDPLGMQERQTEKNRKKDVFYTLNDGSQTTISEVVAATGITRRTAWLRLNGSLSPKRKNVFAPPGTNGKKPRRSIF